jgi:hypothetical protein
MAVGPLSRGDLLYAQKEQDSVQGQLRRVALPMVVEPSEFLRQKNNIGQGHASFSSWVCLAASKARRVTGGQ